MASYGCLINSLRKKIIPEKATAGGLHAMIAESGRLPDAECEKRLAAWAAGIRLSAYPAGGFLVNSDS